MVLCQHTVCVTSMAAVRSMTNEFKSKNELYNLAYYKIKWMNVKYNRLWTASFVGVGTMYTWQILVYLTSNMSFVISEWKTVKINMILLVQQELVSLYRPLIILNGLTKWLQSPSSWRIKVLKISAAVEG